MILSRFSHGVAHLNLRDTLHVKNAHLKKIGPTIRHFCHEQERLKIDNMNINFQFSKNSYHIVKEGK